MMGTYLKRPRSLHYVTQGAAVSGYKREKAFRLTESIDLIIKEREGEQTRFQ